MKIKFSTILIVGLLVLILVMGGGVSSKLLLNVYLPAPTISAETVYSADGNGNVADTIITVSPVDGASHYEVYLDEEFLAKTTLTEFSLKDMIGLDGGTFKLTVVAVREISDGKTVVSSHSNVLTVTCAAG